MIYTDNETLMIIANATQKFDMAIQTFLFINNFEASLKK